MNLYLSSATPAFERSLGEVVGSATPEEKRGRIERCRVPQQRTGMLLGEALLAWALFEECGIVLCRQVRQRGEYGKPKAHLAQRRIEFNISHSGTWVLVGIDDEPIGVDIQQHGSYDPRVVDKIMPSDEAMRWRTASDRTEAFYDAWVRRESELKWWGIGIAGLGRDDLVMPEGVRVCKVTAPPGYSAAVCGAISEHGSEKVAVREVGLERLLEFSHDGAPDGVQDAQEHDGSRWR